MVDVIFNGSSNRKPVGVASIELTFDNSDGTITGAFAGYNEVSVRRVGSRDGTSQYYLNNTRCRRKDITHILLGTGVGSHGYSIIEQGMISRLVEAKPEELRAFLEEAAGISKYKERRRETEHRISHTRENLERLKDLREEIEKQLTHLQKQSKDAERYKNLKAEQRKVNAELLALRLSALREEVAEHEHALREKQIALEAAVAAQRSAETSIEKLRVELADRNERFSVVQGSYYKVGAEIARLEQSLQHRKELIQRQSEDLQGTDQQVAEINAHVASDQIELEALERVLGELGPGLEQAYAIQRSSQQSLEHAEQAMEQARAEWERISEELAAAARSIEVEDTRLEQLAAQGQRLEKEEQKHQDERQALSFAEVEQRLETLVAQEERLAAACENAARALESVWTQIQQLREQEKRISTHLDQLRESVQTDRGRLTSLEALQEGAFGKSTEQVNRWLQAQTLDERRRLAQELVVEAGWERAVETVLGPYLQAVGIESIDTVAGSLSDLTEGGLTLIETAALRRCRRVPIRCWRACRRLRPSRRCWSAFAWPIPSRGDRAPQRARGRRIVRDARRSLGRASLAANESQRRSASRSHRARRRDQTFARKHANRGAPRRRGREGARGHAFPARAARRGALLRPKPRPRGGKICSPTRRRSSAPLARSSNRRGNALAALDRAIADLTAEQQAFVTAVDESKARRRARQSAVRTIWPRSREGVEQQRREHQERVAAARASAEQHREEAQAIAIKVESRRSSRESASAALLRVQSQLAHLTKRQQELNAEMQAAAEPLRADEQTLVDEARRAPARRSGSRQGAASDGRYRHAAARDRAAAQRTSAGRQRDS